MSHLATKKKKKKKKPSGSSRAGRKVGAGLHFRLWTTVWRGATGGPWSTGERHGLLANATETNRPD